jgi:hypothetical protein
VKKDHLGSKIGEKLARNPELTKIERDILSKALRI